MGTQKGTSDPYRKEVYDWVISSDLLPFNDPDIPTLLHCSFPVISFAPSSLALSCSWEVLQNLGSDHLPILLSVPLSLTFCPNEHPQSFNFLKACWNNFASYFDSHYSFCRRILISFSSLSPNLPFLLAASNTILKPGGPLKWKKRLVKDNKAFAAAHRSDEDRQAYISASRHASSDIAKANAEAWQAI